MKFSHCSLNSPLFWESLTDRPDATCFALGSGSLDIGCETGTSTKELDPGVTLAVGWEIGTVASLGEVWAPGTGAVLESACRIGAVSSFAGF